MGIYDNTVFLHFVSSRHICSPHSVIKGLRNRNPTAIPLKAIIRTLCRRFIIIWSTPCLKNSWLIPQIDIVATAAIINETSITFVAIGDCETVSGSVCVRHVNEVSTPIGSLVCSSQEIHDVRRRMCSVALIVVKGVRSVLRSPGGTYEENRES